MKTILIGCVGTSRMMLEAMLSINFPISHVFSVDEKYSNNISGYQPIHRIAEENGIPYTKIHKINDSENVEIIRRIEPDYIFVIGFSQLVEKEIIDSAKIGVVGFHPTPLPKMRGRAANVWQVLLGIHETKCSMFFIDEGVDSGDILGQQEYYIDDEDYAIDVERKINEASYKLSLKVLTDIMNGRLNTIKQNEDEATYLLKRSPEDGLINWDNSITDIHRLIRAVSKPYPGAFGNYDGSHKIIIWHAEMQKNIKFIGMPGQIARISSDSIDIVCKDGLLHVTDYENVDNVKMFEGHKLK
ncbi:MAG: formyltransferase family protein [Clostridiales bacterium]|nr:hypothetical protein [Roseburia sp.]MDD7636312.1 formyltransferase family protein [Clostridiales bacterium]MDY4112624.1 formyltransferase family protein [Roseburia sp.]